MLVGKPVRKFVGKDVRVIIDFNGKGIGFQGKLVRDGDARRNHYQVVGKDNTGYCFLRASDVKYVGTKRNAVGGVRQIFMKNIEIKS